MRATAVFIPANLNILKFLKETVFLFLLFYYQNKENNMHTIIRVIGTKLSGSFRSLNFH